MWIGIALLAALTAASGLDGEFLYDDFPYIVNNPQVQGGGLREAFGEPLSGRAELGLYRPLAVLTYQWQAAGRGADASATAMHVVNAVLHVLVSLLVAWTGLRLGLARGVALLGGALFAVHPVHGEAVTWIVGRAELLATLFGLAFLGTMASRTGLRGGLLGTLWWVLACLGKEGAFALPGVLLVHDLWVSRIRSGRVLLVRYAPLAVAFAALAAVRLEVLGRFGPALGGLAPYDHLSFLERVPVALTLAGSYLRLAIWPWPPRIFYHQSEFVGLQLAAFAFLVVALVWVVLERRRPARAFLPVAFLLALVPVLNLRPIQETLAERFLYLPSAFLCLAFAALLLAPVHAEARRRGSVGLTLALPLVVLLVGLTAATVGNRRFRDAPALWNHELAVAPDLPFPHYQTAYFAQSRARDRPEGSVPREDDLRQAIESYRKALALNARFQVRGFRGMPPDQTARAHLNLGIILCQELPADLRQYAAAERHLREARQIATPLLADDLSRRRAHLNPEAKKALLFLALLRHFQDQGTTVTSEEARALLEEARTIPTDPRVPGNENLTQYVEDELQRLLEEE